MKFRGLIKKKKRKSRRYNLKMKFIIEPRANHIKETNSSGFFLELSPRILARGREPSLSQGSSWPCTSDGPGL